MLTTIDVRKFNTLIEINTLINSNYADARSLLTRILESATRLSEGEASSLLLVDKVAKKLYFEIALGSKGPDVQKFSLNIGEGIAGRTLIARRAAYARFRDSDDAIIDDGIALYFAAPASYTGEDVVELQAHGSPAVLHQLVDRCCALGARRARPGEFSERAFLEGKLDLAQAEAVADLIAASDVRAARAARRALEGEFSRRVEAIADAMLRARVHVEAAIDFADEPIDTLGGPQLQADLSAIADALDVLLRDADGNSTISAADLALAIVDEIETPAHHRARFTAIH